MLSESVKSLELELDLDLNQDQEQARWFKRENVLLTCDIIVLADNPSFQEVRNSHVHDVTCDDRDPAFPERPAAVSFSLSYVLRPPTVNKKPELKL